MVSRADNQPAGIPGIVCLFGEIMYKKQEWNNGTRLDALRLNHIEDGIYECSLTLEVLKSVVSNNDSQEYQELMEKKIEELTDRLEKQKKEITALKTKVTKLQKTNSEE